MKNAWRNWPVMGAVLGAVAVSALALTYWSSVQDRQRYLQSRNFRLLAVLAGQTEMLLENRIRVFKDEVASSLTSLPKGQWVRWTASPVRTQDSDNRNPARRDLSEGEVWVDARTPSSDVARYQSRVTNEDSTLQFDWFPADSKKAFVSLRMPVIETLRVMFDAKRDQGAFDTVILADRQGRVVYATGRRTAEMRATAVTALLPAGPQPQSSAAALADTISEQRVHIAGVDYRMFMQPCCRTNGATPGTGFVVIGLVESQAMLEGSLAISPVLVLAGAVLVIAMLVGWAFLKVALIGAQQRVTRIDVLQLGASGIFGLALVTILLLTTSAYARLSADVDAQLEQLADRLDERLAQEVEGAAAQLQLMTNTLQQKGCLVARESKNEPPQDPCGPRTAAWTSSRELPPQLQRKYPDFTAYALLDDSGFQRVKVAFSDPTRRRLDVADRPYFQLARSGEALWKFASCPEGCVLESHWSWTTGKPQVVLSTPTRLAGFPVAALSIPMRPLLEPVLPPGFEFAVIDQHGLVQFHSDKQRNVHENLLVETDQNLRLRSLVTSHGAGTLNTSYWGRPYRAYVRPTLAPGWSIVTLHAKQPTRALVLEWTAVALLMQVGYMVLWMALTLALMASSASWLWPDPLRRPWYLALAVLYSAALIAWIVMATRVDRYTTVWVGLLLPPALWGLTCSVLMRRPKDVGQAKAWSDLCRDYRLAGALMLAITAAVPAASFFALSSGLHLEAYLKERQIALAHKVAPLARCEKQPGLPGKLDDVGYEDVFYGSDLTCASAVSGSAPPAGARKVHHSKFEDYLPYFTSASVALRELMHPRSDDDAWTSERIEPARLAVTVPALELQYRLAVVSPLMPVLGIASLGNDSRLVWTAVISLLMLAGVLFGAYWIVVYLLRRVVLADVVEPVRTNGHVVTSPGQHVLVICDQPTALAEALNEDLRLPLMPILTAPDVSSAWRKARRAVNELDALQRIVIPDLDDQSEDVGLMRRKLELLEELMTEPDQTVLLLTTMSKKALASSVRDSWRWNHESERWSKVLATLSVINTRPAGGPTSTLSGGAARAAWWRELQDLMREQAHGLRQWWTGSRARSDWRKDLLDSEAAAYKPVEPFCRELQDTPAFKTGSLTRDQILEELEERAGSIYRSLWQSCDENERVVLEHVAQHGLASAASRRVVRRLLARGLLRKDPHLRMMNRSFQRFVLETERRQEVVALECQAGASLWDRLRVPLGLAAVTAAVFLVATQREAFDATLTMAVGVTTAVPTLIKLTTLLTQVTAKEPKPPA